MLAAAITANTFDDAVADISKAKAADLIELRLDYLKNPDDENVGRLIKLCKKPVIATCRSKFEGGFYTGGEEKRLIILEAAIKAGAKYIDIELDSGTETIKTIIKNKKNAKIIVSHHNFNETPDNLQEVYNNIKNINPDFIKIVTFATSVTDNFKLFDIIKTAKKENRKIAAFCMGTYGKSSRILSIILGSEITYASVGIGKESAIGQLTIDESINEYGIKKINKNTKICGLIGNPVEHSWSHIIHNLGFGKLGINAVYMKFQVDNLKEFVEYFKKQNVLGFSVTIPHKVEVMKYLDDIDAHAKSIGAVNTVVSKNKKLIGYNTDCQGAIAALKAKTSVKSKNIAVIGAGGSARAIVYGLKKENANITIFNRTVKNARLLADEFNCHYWQLKDIGNFNYDILINTTPIGMHPKSGEIPISPASIRKNTIVFDIVFNPYKTRLLLEAEKRKCTIIPGFEMLVNGAIMQFELWTGKKAPEQLMRKRVMEHIKNAAD